MIFLTSVPIANPIEVQVPIVVADNFADLFTILMDLSPHEVLLAERVRIILIEARNVVSFIFECHFSYYLVTHRSNEDATQVVIALVPANFRAIIEFSLLVSMALDGARLEAKVDLILEPPSQFIITIGPNCDEVTPGWMVARLFKK